MIVSKELLEITKLIKLDHINSLKLIDSKLLIGKHVLLHEVNEAALYQFDSSDIEIDIINIMKSNPYPSGYQISVITKRSNQWECQDKSINEIKKMDIRQGISYIYFPPIQTRVSMRSFEELIAHLRSEEGCPWDREQTHLTLRSNILEETYEVLDAIDKQDDAALKEELGDLLLQIVLHSQIAFEQGAFSLTDVIQGIHQKIVSRHPHVFKDWDVASSIEVIKNWEILKSRERERKGVNPSTSILASVPKILPALSLAQEYQKRAARVGFDWPEITPVIEKVKEEFTELMHAKNKAEEERELGDLLFALVNLVRWYGEDAESVLRKMNERFYKRFNFLERTVSAEGKKLDQLTLSEMDLLWEQAKKAESNET